MVLEQYNQNNPLKKGPRISWNDLTITSKNWALIVSMIRVGSIKNPFDDKVIVIDEIHNFVSRIVGSGYTCKALYPIIMSSEE